VSRASRSAGRITEMTMIGAELACDTFDDDARVVVFAFVDDVGAVATRGFGEPSVESVMQVVTETLGLLECVANDYGGTIQWQRIPRSGGQG
jgi:hypothetical protein